jgi:hypothetical protein
MKAHNSSKMKVKTSAPLEEKLPLTFYDDSFSQRMGA